mmetsp:Transcript_87541/g.203630  ORF Transcript_87541/g.203630 Transcript_87541/m.203630 type:complete len:231 (+) Transcript_87541:115-807(+)
MSALGDFVVPLELTATSTHFCWPMASLAKLLAEEQGSFVFDLLVAIAVVRWLRLRASRSCREVLHPTAVLPIRHIGAPPDRAPICAQVDHLQLEVQGRTTPFVIFKAEDAGARLLPVDVHDFVDPPQVLPLHHHPQIQIHLCLPSQFQAEVVSRVVTILQETVIGERGIHGPCHSALLARELLAGCELRKVLWICKASVHAGFTKRLAHVLHVLRGVRFDALLELGSACL